MPSSAEGLDGLFEDLARDERPRSAFPSLSRYEILGVLGEGAAGIVYRARHRELGTAVALKVLRPHAAMSELGRQRFRREAQTAASFRHPNVVAVHDAGEEDGRLYLVMELVEGSSLAHLLAGRSCPTDRLLRILERAARGVGAAHERGVVHRDVKPANLLVTASGDPKVGDFGLAHLLDSSAELTRTGATLGTPLYMAPEQVEGRSKELSPRTDVYSLGAILYEILAGRPPHEAATPMELYGKILREEPAALRGTPRDLETVCLKALEKEPGRRYPTASAFAEDLRRALDGEPIEARPPGPGVRLLRRARKHRLALGLSLAAAAAVATIVAVGASARGERVGLLREHARVSLDAVLKLRRAGANAEMAAFVPGLEAAYRQALASAPELAEIEYLMGRLQRAMLEDEKAEAYQERALAKEPDYAPALYERAILRTARYASELSRANAEARALPEGPVTAKSARESPRAEPARPEPLARLREGILADCAALERSPRGRYVTDANQRTLRGLLAFHRRDYDEARRILEAVTKDDPELEDGWHALGSTLSRQAVLHEQGSADRDAAVRRFDEADALWSRAIERDAGYGPHRLGRGLLRRSRGLFLMKRGGDAEAELRRSESDLGRALELKANAAEALYRRSNVRDLAGVSRMGVGKDPTEDFDGAERDLGEGIARFGERGEFRIARASLRVHRAMWRARKREDPFADLALAEEDLLAALRLEAWADEARNVLGSMKITRADYRKRRGEDPMPDLEAAVADLSEALRRNRELTPAWTSRGWARMEKALLRGDPTPELLLAEEDFTEAIRLTPTQAEAWARRGRTRLLLSRADDAVADLRRGIELNPSYEAQYGADLAEAMKRAR